MKRTAILDEHDTQLEQLRVNDSEDYNEQKFEQLYLNLTYDKGNLSIEHGKIVIQSQCYQKT